MEQEARRPETAPSGDQGLAQAVAARARWPAAILSPWVQRWWAAEGAGQGRPTALSERHTQALVQQAERHRSGNRVWQPDVGAVSPATFESFASQIVERHSPIGDKYHVHAAEVRPDEESELPLAPVGQAGPGLGLGAIWPGARSAPATPSPPVQRAPAVPRATPTETASIRASQPASRRQDIRPMSRVDEITSGAKMTLISRPDLEPGPTADAPGLEGPQALEAEADRAGVKSTPEIEPGPGDAVPPAAPSLDAVPPVQRAPETPPAPEVEAAAPHPSRPKERPPGIQRRADQEVPGPRPSSQDGPPLPDEPTPPSEPVSETTEPWPAEPPLPSRQEQPKAAADVPPRLEELPSETMLQRESPAGHPAEGIAAQPPEPRQPEREPGKPGRVELELREPGPTEARREDAEKVASPPPQAPDLDREVAPESLEGPPLVQRQPEDDILAGPELPPEEPLPVPQAARPSVTEAEPPPVQDVDQEVTTESLAESPPVQRWPEDELPTPPSLPPEEPPPAPDVGREAAPESLEAAPLVQTWPEEDVSALAKAPPPELPPGPAEPPTRPAVVEGELATEPPAAPTEPVLPVKHPPLQRQVEPAESPTELEEEVLARAKSRARLPLTEPLRPPSRLEVEEDRFPAPKELALPEWKLPPMARTKPPAQTTTLRVPQVRLQTRFEKERAEAGPSRIVTGELPLPPAPRLASAEMLQRQPSASAPDLAMQPEGIGVVQRVEEAETIAGQPPEEGEEEMDLDKLARQVYPIIRRLLAVERERRSARW